MRAAQTWMLLLRFGTRYSVALFALTASAVIGWAFAATVSDYTKGGWEIHIIERAIGLNIHFHHWYYGIPLGLLAFATIEWKTTTSIFLFGLGQTLAAHSFINEHGIPSIVEGGPTLPVSPEVYFPIVTALTLLYAFFLVRREEWLYRAREREEIAESYLYPKARAGELLDRLNGWALRYMVYRRRHVDRDTHIEYGEWRGLDRTTQSEWELHYTASPFDDQLNLLVVRIEHIPLQGRSGQLDEWIQELDAALKPLAQPAVNGPDAVFQMSQSAGDATPQATGRA